jgi:hypothetical protein
MLASATVGLVLIGSAPRRRAGVGTRRAAILSRSEPAPANKLTVAPTGTSGSCPTSSWLRVLGHPAPVVMQPEPSICRG